MAISHAHPLVLLLVVSSFVSPALSVKFLPCFTGVHKFIKVKTVDVSPYPVKRSGNAKVTVTGYTSKEILDGVTVNIGLSIPMMPVSTKSYPLCDVTACPVAPGPLVLTIPNIFTEKEKRVRAYNVFVTINETPMDPKNAPLMCVGFACRIKGYTSMLSQVIG